MGRAGAGAGARAGRGARRAGTGLALLGAEGPNRPPARGPLRADPNGDRTMDTQTETTQTPLSANDQAHADATRRRARRVEAATIELKRRYPNVVAIETTGANGPTRVTIECDDPQTRVGATETMCEGTRGIAVQDLFQVHRCEACQGYVVRRARRAKAEARDKALRAAAKAAK